MDRRVFLFAIVFVCGCSREETPRSNAGTSVRLPTNADQQTRAGAPTVPPRVAVLFFGPRESPAPGDVAPAIALLRSRLTELGYVQGQSIVVEDHYAEGDPVRLTRLAQEIVDSKPDVIVTIAAAATAAARQATSTIPIVMAHAGNPEGSGLVASLSHPGGNVTGTTSLVADLGMKQVEVLRELIPGITKLGVLANPTNASTTPFLANVREAATRYRITLVVAEVTRAEELDGAFVLLRDARPDALLVMMEPLLGMNRARILDFAAANRLPASYDIGRELTRQGGLISYGPVLTTHYALVADYVDKILKGARPADLPVLQPTEFSLAVNLKTARTLGLTVPQSLVVRADEVIQ